MPSCSPGEIHPRWFITRRINNGTDMTDENTGQTKRQKLVLIDGQAIIHRAFHAVPENLATRKGEVVNATFGFTSILIKALTDIKPDYLAVTFDRPTASFRHQEFSEYKAHRPALPDIMRPQFARVREVVEAFGIPIYEKDSFEADDVLGTLSVQATQQGVDTIIFTGDMDTLQLVNEHVQVMADRRGISEVKNYDEVPVQACYGIPPQTVPDVKGRVGDTSDNIPGALGIGEKTASKLLAEYGDLEGVLAHIDELKPKEQRLLRDAADQARQSKYLATIVLDAPVQLDLQACRVGNIHRDQVLALFRELEFRSLLEKVLALLREQEATSASPDVPQPGDELAAASAGELEPGLMEGEEEEALQVLVSSLRDAGVFALDTETTSDDIWHAELVGISCSMAPGEAYYIPVGHVHTLDGQEPEKQLLLALVLEQLRPTLENPAIRKYMHNAKYDMLALAHYKIRLQGLAFDTMLGAYLVDPGRRGLGLKDQVFQRLGHIMTNISELIGRGSKMISMSKVPIRRSPDYTQGVLDMS